MTNQPNASTDPAFRLEARWERPLVPVAGEITTATLLVRVVPDANPLPPARRAPLDLAFALDRSGSMAGEELALVKDAADAAAGFLREDDRVSLTVYDHTVEILQPLAPATARVKTALRLALRGIDAGGSTALADGWLTACGELATAQDTARAMGDTRVRIRRTLLLTDGLANVGLTDPGELARHAHELRRRGIATSTLGVGDGYNEELLAGLAEAGGGTFQHIQGRDEYRAFFQKEVGELLSVVAAGLTLTLTAPEGIHVHPLSAYPCERTGKTFTIPVGDVPAGVEIPLVFGITVVPSPAGTSRQIELAAAWADTAADAERRLEIPVPPLLTVDAATVAATAPDRLVQEQAAVQHAARERREAMRLDRAGRHAESRERIRRSQFALAGVAFSPDARAFVADGDALLAAPAAAPFAESLRKQTAAAAHARTRRRTE